MWPERFSVVVLVSGRGSNLQALMDAGCPIGAVVSNVPGAAALDRARRAGIATHELDHREFSSRDAFDAALANLIESCGKDGGPPSLVVLAGFMRILGADFVHRFEGRLINIHPSLLPAFPGLHTHERAIAEGAFEHGCTVHFVVPEMDAGPIIAQARVPVPASDTPDALAARVLAKEHELLPRVVRRFAAGRVRLENGVARCDGRVRVFD